MDVAIFDFTLVTVVMVIGKEYGLDSHWHIHTDSHIDHFYDAFIVLVCLFELALRYLPKITCFTNQNPQSES